MSSIAWGGLTAQDVLEQIPDPPSYSAVRALLRLLEERGHVRHVTEGQKYVYLPAVGRSDARRSALAHVGGRSSEARSSRPSRRSSIRHGPSSRTEELDRLSDLITKAKKEGR